MKKVNAKRIRYLLRGLLAILMVVLMIIPQGLNVEAASAKLSKSKVTIHVGNSVTLRLKNAKVVSWRSSNKKVATVSARGVVTAKKKGTVYITCLDSNRKKYKCKVVVKNHIYRIKVIAATKAKKGYTFYKCKVCGKNHKSKYSVYKPTEASVYKDMIAMKKEYPEGAKWTAYDSYFWDAGVFSGGYGCVGFAFLLSDHAYSKYNKARRVSGAGWYKKFKVGDIVRINNDSHSVVILKKKANSVIVVEGAYNGTVHWGREISMDYIKKTGSYFITRYPT